MSLRIVNFMFCTIQMNPYINFLIRYTSCCWIDTLQVNPSTHWMIATRIDLAYRQDINRINTSPVTAMQPIVRLQRGCSHSIRIPGKHKLEFSK